jgi:hypothetical protein
MIVSKTAMESKTRYDPDPVIEYYKRDIDLTLIRESLKLTPTQRLERLMELQRFAEELRRAGRKARSVK